MHHSIRYLTRGSIFILALAWIFPFWVVLVNTLKTPRDYVMGNFWDLPNEIGLLENIRYAWVEAGLGSGFVNSIQYGIVGAVFSIIIAALAAFSLTVLDVKGRLFWFLLIYSGTVFPLQMYLIPLFRMFSDWNLYDTRIGLIFLYTAVSVPFCLFVLRNYFSTIPREIVEAARIDGCSDFRIFVQMILPLA